MPTSPRLQSRLPRRPLTARERSGELLRGALAVLLLVGLVVGVPAGLLMLVGDPLPSTPPGPDWLLAPLGPGAVLDLLAVLLWAAWAHLLGCLVLEVRDHRRDVVRPTPAGPTRAVARRLVATVLLLGAGVPVAVAAPPTAPPPADRPVVTSAGPRTAAPTDVPTGLPDPAWGGRTTTGPTSAPVPDLRPTPVPDSTPDPTPDPTPHPAARETVAREAAPGPVWVVRPPQGRHHECLWDIAERTLGDPLRYREIYDLNRDRVQPDGGRLLDADLIRPGWTLQLPADARVPAG
ncbi:LysM peptidoglycan-binding domain-containing protein [Kineococcus gynurae]|uniref:LysM peptidoglycan-binding domain-containing protein n=1 Tax=Kineococcus gynurae TaxID=452979 RepID=A0ABV5LXX9_9ACTN